MTDAARPVTREQAEAAVRTLIQWAGDDPDREGLAETPARVVRAYEELFSGYGADPREYLRRTFEEVGGYDELVVLTHIPVVSFCEHHMLPFLGRAAVGYLPDNPVFYDYLRGREILAFVGEMHGQPREEAQKRAAALLTELALEDAAEEFAVNYSTGMKKKLGLACALIHDPAVLILDEPTNGLDPRASRHVQDRIRVSATQGKTIFLSTHLLDMAERLCGRVGIIDKGDLVAVGPLKDLQDKLAPGGSLEEVFLKVTQADEDGSGG